LLLLQASVAPSAQPETPPDRLHQWLDAVYAHEPGIPGKAAIEVATWAGADLEAVVVEAKQHARRLAKSELDNANDILLRGAAMHADIGRLIPEDVERRSPRQLSVLTVSDGRWQGMRYTSMHWYLGRALLDGVMPAPGAHQGVLAWYRQNAADLLRIRLLAEAVVHLGRARQIFPNDGRLLFFSGLLHERFSSSALQAAAASVADSNRGTTLGSGKAELNRAERFFRETLALEPQNIEARIRHGHVLGELGHHAEAAAELRRAIDEGAAGEWLYFAQLFLARQEESLGHPQNARAALEQAAALYPAAQTPRVALSHIARRAGNRRAAQQELQALAALPADERRREDPWWNYYEVR
jgi:tetratricopeptide (TPR) repeat protein